MLGTQASLFELVDVPDAGDAVYDLPRAARLAYRRLTLKVRERRRLTITAPHGDCPEIDAAGGALQIGTEGALWPCAHLCSDGQLWHFVDSGVTL